MALKLQIFAQSPLFRCLTDQQRDSFAKCGKIHAYSGGDVIVKQGTAAEDIFIILRGGVKVVRSVTLPSSSEAGATVASAPAAEGRGPCFSMLLAWCCLCGIKGYIGYIGYTIHIIYPIYSTSVG